MAQKIPKPHCKSSRSAWMTRRLGAPFGVRNRGKRNTLFKTPQALWAKRDRGNGGGWCEEKSCSSYRRAGAG